jgi:hypothetical protein
VASLSVQLSPYKDLAKKLPFQWAFEMITYANWHINWHITVFNAGFLRCTMNSYRFSVLGRNDYLVSFKDVDRNYGRNIN